MKILIKSFLKKNNNFGEKKKHKTNILNILQRKGIAVFELE